jgi:hypothetical protein
MRSIAWCFCEQPQRSRPVSNSANVFFIKV